mgnify:CR=1 FL=1
MKLLVVDHDWQLSRQLENYLENHGFEVRSTSSLKQGREALIEWGPKLILCDLILPDGSGLDLLRIINENPGLKDNQPHFIVMSAHNQVENIKVAIDQGVNDYIVKPFDKEQLVQRLLFHCQSLKTLPELEANNLAFVPDDTKTLHLIHLLLKQALHVDSGISETLFKICQMLSLKSKCVRCNVVEVFDEQTGIVRTSHDDRNFTDFELDLSKYPEILQVKHNPRIIAIENIENDANLNFIKKHFKNINFNSMIVCPLFKNSEFYGVLTLKFPNTKSTFKESEIRFVEIASQVISLALSHSNHQQLHVVKSSAA